MKVHLRGLDLQRLRREPSFTAGLPPDVVTTFRAAIGLIEAAKEERDLANMACLGYEALDERRRAIRLDRHFLLLCEANGDGFTVRSIERRR